MSKFKKALSLALSATMIMTSLVVAPVTASAAPPNPDNDTDYEFDTSSNGDEGFIRYEYVGDDPTSNRPYIGLRVTLDDSNFVEYIEQHDVPASDVHRYDVFAGPIDYDSVTGEATYEHLYVPFIRNVSWGMRLSSGRDEGVSYTGFVGLNGFNEATKNNYTLSVDDITYYKLTTEDGETVETPLDNAPSSVGDYRCKIELHNNTTEQSVVTMYRDYTIVVPFVDEDSFKVTKDGSELVATNSESTPYNKGDVTASIKIEAKDLYAADVIENKEAVKKAIEEAIEDEDYEAYLAALDSELRPEKITGLDEFNNITGADAQLNVLYLPAKKNGNYDGLFNFDKDSYLNNPSDYKDYEEVPTKAGSYYAVAVITYDPYNIIGEGTVPSPGRSSAVIYAPFDILRKDNEKELPEFTVTDGYLQDGKISGVDDTMEYSLDGGKTWPDVPKKATEITDVPVLVPVQIRYKQTPTVNVGEPVEVKALPKAFKVGDTIGVKDGDTSGVWILRDDSKENYDVSYVGQDLKVTEIVYNEPTKQYYVRVTPNIEGSYRTIAITSEKFDVNPYVIVKGGTGTEEDPYTFMVLGEYYDYDIVAEGDELTVTKLLNDEEVEMEGNPAVAKITAEGGTYDPTLSPKKEYEATVTGIEDINALNPELKASASKPVYYDEDGNELETPPTMPGTYKAVATVTVDGEEYEIETEFTIEKAENEDVDYTYLSVTGPATRWFKTGTITGVKEGMEYSTNGGKTWKPVTGKQINGLGVGEVLIRFAETDEKKAGQAVVAKVNLRYKQSTIVPVVVPVPVPTPTPTPVPTPVPTPTPQPTNPWGFWGWLFNPWKR